MINNKLKNLQQIASLDDFTDTMHDVGLTFPVMEDFKVLRNSVNINGKVTSNAIAIHPLEGFDAGDDGGPSELTFRRYERFARGGAGLVWYESVTVAEDGKSSPRQMIINKESVKSIKALVDRSKQTAADYHGSDFKQYNILQLTHSGRSSVDQNWQAINYNISNNTIIGEDIGNNQTAEIYFSNEMIETLIEHFIKGAVLAAEAGFDSVDVKICHNGLLSDLLSAFNRPGKYGGSFENRTRAVMDIVHGIKKRTNNALDIAVRLNAYDFNQQPLGWGMPKANDTYEPDLTEPIRLCRMLVKEGVKLFNISAMMPDQLMKINMHQYGSTSNQHIKPYAKLYKLLKATKEIKKQVPEGLFVGTGLSQLNQFGANVAAGAIHEGWFDIAGFGRQALAYPDFAKDILQKNSMTPRKCCIKCGKCFELVFEGHVSSGCPIHDQEIYLPMYRKHVLRIDD